MGASINAGKDHAPEVELAAPPLPLPLDGQCDAMNRWRSSSVNHVHLELASEAKVVPPYQPTQFGQYTLP